MVRRVRRSGHVPPYEIAAPFETAVEEFGSLDVLVTNAAVQTETAAELTVAE